MFKRCYWCLSWMRLVIAGVLIVAQHSLGERIISLDHPLVLTILIGIVVLLFLPPLILSLFTHLITTYINVLYQFFIVSSFVGMIPIGLMISNGFLITLISVLGTIASALSYYGTGQCTRRKLRYNTKQVESH